MQVVGNFYLISLYFFLNDLFVMYGHLTLRTCYANDLVYHRKFVHIGFHENTIILRSGKTYWVLKVHFELQ